MNTTGDRRRGILRLAAGCGIVSAVWCGLLPRLLSLAPVARHVALMERSGVDPAAMYYTELERLPLRPAWVEERVVLWPGSAGPARSPAPAGSAPRRAQR